MKRVILFFVILSLLFGITACSGRSASSAASDRLDMEEIASAVTEKYELLTGFRYSSRSEAAGEYLDEDLIRSYYGDIMSMPDFKEVEAYEVYIDESNPIQPCEFGIFKMAEGADTELFMSFLRARIDLKISNAVAYPTMDTEALTTAKFSQCGSYLWYCAVKGANDEIDRTFSDSFADN